jgi:hypothetical protein
MDKSWGEIGIEIKNRIGVVFNPCHQACYLAEKWPFVWGKRRSEDLFRGEMPYKGGVDLEKLKQDLLYHAAKLAAVVDLCTEEVMQHHV